MTSFALDEDHRGLLDHADRFCRDKLYPFSDKMDAEEWWPPETFPMLAEVGFLGVTVPTQLGGSDMDFMSSCMIQQAMGRWNHAIALSYGAHENLCVNNILRNANDSLKEKYIPDLINGKKVGALGLTEPGAGSDALGSMRTTAKKEGDKYILNGSKIYITNGPIADTLLVYAKTDPEKGAHGISAFIVEKDYPGFKVAQKLTKMGYRGSQTAELVFEDCEVPAENLVGEENKGVAVVMSGLDLERAYLAFCAVGMAERALDLSVEYSLDRKQFDKPIASFQMVQAKLADMYTKIEAAKALSNVVAMVCNEAGHDEGGRGEIHKQSAASIYFATKICMEVMDEAVQVHGGTGYMWETEVNRLYRGGKLLEIGAGTQEVRRMIIAKELLAAA
jgi:isovaleryl-CoA dehydrogenase